MDYCSFVNVFQGTGEIDLPEPRGLAAKWFFIKAQCGNTTPAAVSPFGAMSAGPYTGGYPTGYGDHRVNTHARVRHFDEGRLFKGFTHIHQSGTGAIGYYYNFLLVTPHTDENAGGVEYGDEKAQPGYYSCVCGDDILCEVTALGKGCVHRYTFRGKQGRITADFGSQGLCLPGNSQENQPRAEVVSLTKDGDTVTAHIKTEGVSLYFALKTDAKTTLNGEKAEITPDGNTAEISISVSFTDENTAKENLPAGDFDETRKASYNEWNDALSRFSIETEDAGIKEIFYSNLYHSIVKPCDFDGESFVYDKGMPFITDFSTLWDMYKTQLPLIFMLYRDMGEKICETLLRLCEKLGNIPNSFGINGRYEQHSVQARMLGDYVLLTAYRYGVKLDPARMIKNIVTDVFADNKTDFTVGHKCASNTWVLDMADGCALAADAAKELGDTETEQKLRPLAELWRTAYDEKTGLLSAKSSYYEGTLYNYSFRQHVDMDARIELAGGKDNFVRQLDRFFGYGGQDAVRVLDPDDAEAMKNGTDLGRFEGFNNESDTETPFTYIFADRHDRTCEVISAGLKYMFTTGRGGLPGNNDTGALSSYYCLTAAGLFPVAGQDLFLFGSPVIDGAELKLFNGNTLKIKVLNGAKENIYVSDITFNGKKITGFRIKASELLSGGELIFKKRR